MSAPFRNAPGADRGVEVVKRKVCMVGEQGVGKTSLVRRFTTGTFDDMYVRTLGASVSKKAVELETVYGRTVRVEFVILDIVGRRTFLQLFQDAYFSGAAGVVGAFDLTEPDTLRDLVPWIDAVHAALGTIPVVALANKADLDARIAIRDTDARSILDPLGLAVIRTSAKTGKNVEEAFLWLARAMLLRSGVWARDRPTTDA